MEIQKVNIYPSIQTKTTQKEEKHDNRAIENQTDVVSSAASAAARSIALANIHRTMNIQQAGNDYRVEGKYKVVGQMPTKEANEEWAKRGYNDMPYKDGETAQIVELTEETRFVRTYDGKNSHMPGSWIMKYDDIKGLTAEEIADKFALPQVPKFLCDCVLPAGTKIRTGECNPLYGWNGGGLQFDLMGQRVGKFENEREIGQGAK